MSEVLYHARERAMHIPPMRPTFELRVPLPRDAVVQHLGALLERDEHPVRGSGVGHHLLVTVPERDRHFWSPWLSIEVHDDDDDERGDAPADGARVEGRFSPSPAIWTGFMMTWIALATLAFFVVVFGVAQWMMDHDPSALIFLALLAPLAVALYWSSRVGQRLAHDQMHELYDTLTGALEAATDREPDARPASAG